MGSNELNLDYKPNGDMTLQKNLEDQSDQSQKLQQFLARLEQEHVKIDAFKRELPLCMQLLENAMEVCRQQLGVGSGGEENRPVIEEYIATKQSFTDDDSRSSEKVNWLASVQLWSQTNEASPKKWSGGAFLPFSKEKGSNYGSGGSDLAIVPVEEKINRTSETVVVEEKAEKCKSSNVDNPSGTLSVVPAVSGGQSQTHRKARRCWSPDLHRRFVNALQVLGGSQVATPKQIRELMKVDGLTNDEVKSHLQKYRLHTRRPIQATPQTAVAAGPPQLVVLGGIWVPPEYATSATVYSTHPSNSAQFCTTTGPPVTHGFYSSPTPRPNANYHGGTARYKSGQQGLVDCNVKGSGEERVESMEEEEEEVEEERKSGSSSSNGGSDGGDDSNGSEVTLKF